MEELINFILVKFGNQDGSTVNCNVKLRNVSLYRPIKSHVTRVLQCEKSCDSCICNVGRMMLLFNTRQ